MNASSRNLAVKHLFQRGLIVLSGCLHQRPDFSRIPEEPGEGSNLLYPGTENDVGEFCPAAERELDDLG